MYRPLNVLIIEDDEYKCNGITALLPAHWIVKVQTSVSGAVKAVFSETYHLILLDMALPTFGKKNGSASGSSQPQGGIEVLRALKQLKSDTKVIIISQYPGIAIDNVFISLADSVRTLTERYNVSVIGAVSYEFESDQWSDTLIELLEIV